MRHHGLRSIRNSYRTSEAMLLCVEIKETNGFNSPKSKPHFLLGLEEKTRILRGCCRDNGPKSICWALALSEGVQWYKDRSIVRKV